MTPNTGNQLVLVDQVNHSQFTGINDSLKKAYGSQQRKAFASGQVEGKELEIKLALRKVD